MGWSDSSGPVDMIIGRVKMVDNRNELLHLTKNTGALLKNIERNSLKNNIEVCRPEPGAGQEAREKEEGSLLSKCTYRTDD